MPDDWEIIGVNPDEVPEPEEEDDWEIEDKYDPNLADIRATFRPELEDPQVKELLGASTIAEVGDQPPHVWKAYMESVVNRAAARNSTLADTVLDTDYYPAITHQRMSRKMGNFSDEEMQQLDGMIEDVVKGSNISRYATGNESLDVHSGGAPVSYNPGTGERFVQENPDLEWVDKTANEPKDWEVVSAGAIPTKEDDWEIIPPSTGEKKKPYFATREEEIASGGKGPNYPAEPTPQQAKGAANREELSGAIAKVEKEGYTVPHFIGLPNEPEGDRAPTRDMEQLVTTLATQQTNAVRARNLKEAARIGKERAYWEDKIKTQGMSAEQWKKQTGEEDPRYPHEPAFTAKQSKKELIDSVESGINAAKEVWEGGKRGLMQSGLGLGEMVNRYAFAPVVHGIREAIDYVAPGSDLAKTAKFVDDEFYKHTVEIPAAQRAQLGKESAKSGAVGEVAHAVGTMAGDLPQIMLTGGLLPELKAGISLVNTLGHGAAAMTVPAMRAGMDAAEEVKKKGGSDIEQYGAWIKAAGIMATVGSLPMATKSGAATVARRVAERSVKSIPLASAAVESGRMLDNAVSDIFGGQKRPFSLEENIKGTIPMAMLGGVAGRSTAKSGFERRFGFSPEKIDRAEWMRARMDAEGIAKATPEKVMEWDAQWKKQEGVWPEEAPPAVPETVRRAAIQTKDGQIFEGTLHSDAVEGAKKAGALPENEYAQPDLFAPGFTTSDGRFVDNAEAYKIAQASKQPNVDLAPGIKQEKQLKARYGEVYKENPVLDAMDLKPEEAPTPEVAAVAPGAKPKPTAEEFSKFVEKTYAEIAARSETVTPTAKRIESALDSEWKKSFVSKLEDVAKLDPVWRKLDPEWKKSVVDKLEEASIAKATPEKVMELSPEWKKSVVSLLENAAKAAPEEVNPEWKKSFVAKLEHAALSIKPPPVKPSQIKRSRQALGIVADHRSQKGFMAVHDEAKNIADYLNKAEHWGPWNSAVGRSVASDQKAFDNVMRQEKALKALVPDAAERKGVTMYREANGDMAKITGWGANVKDADAKAAYRSAGALTAKGKELTARIAQRFEELNMWLNANGIDVADRENYITHMLHTSGADPRTGAPIKSLSSFFRYSKARTYDSFFQAFQAGEKPKTLDAVDILSAYEMTAMRAINNKRFVDSLKFGEARDGRKMVAPSSIKLTPEGEGYKPLDAPGLEHSVVHPEIHSMLSKILGPSRIREWLEERTNNPFANIGKGVLRTAWEAQKYTKGTMFSFSAFHQMTEGTHAFGHRVNAFNTKTKEINLNDPEQYDAAVHGLMLRADKISQEQFMHGVGADSYNLVTLMGRKFGGPAGKAMADMIDGYSHYLFEDYIPRIKMDTYRHIVHRNTGRFAKDLKSGKTSMSQIKSLSADQTNAAYGHLNYTKMARSATLRDLFQIMFLAPDFFEARARFAGQAAKGVAGIVTGSKIGTEQMIALAWLGVGQYMAARILNYLDHGDSEWDLEHAFQVKTNLGGILPAERWVGLRSVPEDIVKSGLVSLARGDINKAGEEAGRFIQHRLAAFPRLAVDNIFHHNWKGEKTDFGKSVGDMLSNIVPMPAQGIVAKLTRPKEAQSISPFETFLKSTGIQIHRVSPLSDAHELASKWLKVNDREEFDRREASSFPQSKYIKLRYALEDSDWEAARTEAKMLREGGATIETFQQSLMKPFTKSLADDQRFYKSLDKHDKAVFDAALKRRAEVLDRYRKHVNSMGEAKHVTVQTLHEKMRDAEIAEAEAVSPGRRRSKARRSGRSRR